MEAEALLRGEDSEKRVNIVLPLSEFAAKLDRKEVEEAREARKAQITHGKAA